MTGKRRQSSPVGSPSSGNISDGSSKDQDKFLPIANVSRIMKKSLPTNAKISKEAKETVQECVSEFISFITGEASDKCQREKRKTINGDDLLWAMTTLGFENYVGTLKIYLNKYREIEGDRNGMQVTTTNSSPTNNNISTSSVGEFSNSTTRPDYNAYYSLGEQVQEKSYAENMVMNINGGFSIGGNMRSEIGDGNGNMIMATPHLHSWG